jgi:hypothetical protein
MKEERPMMKIAFVAAAAVAVLTTAPLIAPAKAQGVDVRIGGDRYDHPTTAEGMTTRSASAREVSGLVHEGTVAR